MTTVITPDGTEVQVQVDVDVKVKTPPASHTETTTSTSVPDVSYEDSLQALHDFTFTTLRSFFPLILAIVMLPILFRVMMKMLRMVAGESSSSSHTWTPSPLPKKESDYLDKEIERIKTASRSGTITRRSYPEEYGQPDSFITNFSDDGGSGSCDGGTSSSSD